MPSPPESLPRPPRSINDLPVELKKYIVQLVAEQNDFHLEWIEALHPHLNNNTEEALDEHRRRWFGGLGPLFCTSRLWSELAAPFRFRVLKASKAGLKFSTFVLLKRTHLFQSVHLDTVNQNRLRFALSVMHNSKHIKELHLHLIAFEARDISEERSRVGRVEEEEQDDRDGDDTFASVFDAALLRASALVPTLQCHAMPSALVGAYVKGWTALTHLHLHVTPQRGHPNFAFTAGLANAIVGRPHLETLSVKIGSEFSDFEPNFRYDGLANAISASTNPFSLRHLSLSTPFLNPSALLLVDSLAPTLHSLHLVQSHQQQQQAPCSSYRIHRRLPPSPKPLLTGWYIRPSLPLITPSTFPSLQHLEVATLEGYPSSSDLESFLTPLLAELSTSIRASQLLPLRVHEGRRLRPSEAALLSHLCGNVDASADSKLVVFDCPDIPHHPLHPLLHNPPGDHPVRLAGFRPYLEDLAWWFGDEVAQAVRTGDEAGLVSLAEAAQLLAFERVARVG